MDEEQYTPGHGYELYTKGPFRVQRRIGHVGILVMRWERDVGKSLTNG